MPKLSRISVGLGDCYPALSAASAATIEEAMGIEDGERSMGSLGEAEGWKAAISPH